LNNTDFNLHSLTSRSRTILVAAFATALAAFGQTANPNTAQGPGPGPIGPGPGCNLLPAPASIGASVGLSYFGPPPSASNPSHVGPLQLLRSGKVDDAKGTITLPLYRGTMKGSGKGGVVYPDRCR
jgi:hypothetical protein